MSDGANRWTEERMEQTIGLLLRVGTGLSAALAIVGGVIYLARHGGSLPHYDVFKGEPRDLVTVSGIVRDALAGSGRGVIQLGLLVLIATPVTRVAFSVVAFALQRDRLYVVVTLIVLAVLTAGLTGLHF